MLRSLSTAVTGLQQFQQRIDLIGNNIANVNTVAYKNVRATSSDAFSNTLQSTLGQTVQVGTGVTTSDVSSVFTQGSLMTTGSPTDLAVNGNGFFLVRDPGSNGVFATRDGAFTIDNSGYLINSVGYRVQGFTDGAGTNRGDLKLDLTGAPAGTPADAQIRSFRFDKAGKLQVTLDSETTFTRGQVLLQQFTSPQSLAKAGNNLYTDFAAGGPAGQAAAPGSNGLGVIEATQLEMSNVDLAGEFSNLISAQRAFQANSRIVSTSDEVLQELINLKR